MSLVYKASNAANVHDCRSLTSALQAIVHTKVNRDVLQAKANRGSPHIVTPVEMDFVYPPMCDIVSVSQFAVQADSVWRQLCGCVPMDRSDDLAGSVADLVKCCCRTGATLEGSVIIQAALPDLPHLYVPDVDSLDQMCTKLQDYKAPIRFLEIVGAPGRGKLTLLVSYPVSTLLILTCQALAAGKLTAAIAVVRHAVMTLHWATGYCAPFQVWLLTMTAALPVAECSAHQLHNAHTHITSCRASPALQRRSSS